MQTKKSVEILSYLSVQIQKNIEWVWFQDAHRFYYERLALFRVATEAIFCLSREKASIPTITKNCIYKHFISFLTPGVWRTQLYEEIDFLVILRFINIKETIKNNFRLTFNLTIHSYRLELHWHSFKGNFSSLRTEGEIFSFLLFC